MKDINEIMKSADEDIRMFELLIDLLVEEMTSGEDALHGREEVLFLSRAEMALADYRIERSTQMEADIGMTILRDLLSHYF